MEWWSEIVSSIYISYQTKREGRTGRIGSLRNRTAIRLRTAEWRKNVARDCAFPVLRDIFIRHSVVLSLSAVLLRKVPNIGQKSWQYGPSAYKKDQGPIFSQYGPEQAWLIRDLLPTEIVWKKNPNDRLQRHHKLQARNFYLEQTERLLTSEVIKKKKNKVGRKQKNNILCGVNTFRKKKVKVRENLRAGSFGTVPGPVLSSY